MKKLIFIIIFGIVWCEVNTTEPYIAPGLQIGFNTNKEFFYGFQLSAGMLIRKDHYTNQSLHSPSFCFGLKKYPKSKLTEKYIDLQMMSVLHHGWDLNSTPMGFGVGINHTNGQSSMRIKGYTWFISCIALDYDIRKRLLIKACDGNYTVACKK